MRKHEFIKEDCKCFRKATYYVCKHCKTRIYRSRNEVSRLPRNEAMCFSPDAPLADPQESFKGFLGGTFDCTSKDEDAAETAASN